MEMIEVTGKTIPEVMTIQLQKMPIEAQLPFFSLEKCAEKNYFIDSVVKHPENYKGKPADFLEYPLLVQDGIVIGIKYNGEELYCAENPCSRVKRTLGPRTSSDYWHRDVYFDWVIFRCRLLQ